MRRKIHAYARDEAVIPRELKQHPVYRTPGLSFRPLPFTGPTDACGRVPEPGELHLWRYRPQWNAASRQDNAWIVSDSEQSRARRGYSPALRKRYLTGRALLRSILSSMLTCPPERLQIKDSPDGQPELVHPVPPRKLTIQVAYAGIWILIGMGATEFDMHAAAPLADDLPPDWRPPGQSGEGGGVARSGHEVAAGAQGFVHRTTAAAICDRPATDPLPEPGARSGAVLTTEEPGGGDLQVIDLPMPGRLSAAVATREPVSSILAYGWCRN